MGLAVPDFRAAERNLQLLLQVSGRAGRAQSEGKVILQTFQPEHPVFVALQTMDGLDDYGAFIREEIRKRDMLGYPPKGRLCSLRFDGLDDALVEKAAMAVGEGLRKISASSLKILGPVVCPMHKVRNRYRWHILLKSQKQSDLAKA
ncbi:primosomal protein N', partial [Bradyrhizobium sp. NBAIM08]|nr:primosomal protein N' [Bradyrhizobium sp. NBAIM08]